MNAAELSPPKYSVLFTQDIVLSSTTIKNKMDCSLPITIYYYPAKVQYLRVIIHYYPVTINNFPVTVHCLLVIVH